MSDDQGKTAIAAELGALEQLASGQQPHPHLRLYLDTAEVKEWQIWLSTGIFYGVTCNPLLLERAGVTCSTEALKNLAQQAFSLGAREVQLQTWGDSVSSLLQTGYELGGSDQRIVVKVPATQMGTTAASRLIKSDIPVTLTAVYSVHQALMAAAMGASYAAPYLGRIGDTGKNGRQVVATMQQTLNSVRSPTRLLTASIRQIEDIAALAAQGVDTFTFSPAIARAFFEVPETLTATADFERAAKAMS